MVKLNIGTKLKNVDILNVSSAYPCEAFIFANFANEFTNAKIKAHEMSYDHSHS